MSRIRRSSEAGHTRKFLVVVDKTPECERALKFAARRAAHSGGGLTILACIEPVDFQHWMGVEKIMREEAEDAARAQIDRAIEQAKATIDIEPETVLKEGTPAEAVQELIEEDQDIAILVLGAGSDKDGPGPLVSLFAGGRASGFAIPVTVVPGTLSDEEIEALS
ncbi:MAG: universal stress protein [Pseudomonadota bacterium]